MDEAIASCKEAIRLKPDLAKAHHNLGNALWSKGRLDEAIAAYKEAIRLKPDFALAHNNLAWLLATCPDAKFRDPARAVTLAKKAVELVPNQESYWSTLAVAHYRAGDWKAAREALEKAAALSKGGNAIDWFVLAMVHWQRGEKEAARLSYDKAVRWVEQNKAALEKHPLVAEELRRFREEAAQLLGVEDQPSPKGEKRSLPKK